MRESVPLSYTIAREIVLSAFDSIGLRLVFLAVMFYISEFLFCLLYYFHPFC